MNPLAEIESLLHLAEQVRDTDNLRRDQLIRAAQAKAYTESRKQGITDHDLREAAKTLQRRHKLPAGTFRG